MQVSFAIDQINSLKPNALPDEYKVSELERLDGYIKAEILDNYEGEETEIETPYGMSTELLVGAPYDELYVYYLAAKIDYANEELGKYNASNAMYQATLSQFANYYNRTHTHKSVRMDVMT